MDARDSLLKQHRTESVLKAYDLTFRDNTSAKHYRAILETLLLTEYVSDIPVTSTNVYKHTSTGIVFGVVSKFVFPDGICSVMDKFKQKQMHLHSARFDRVAAQVSEPMQQPTSTLPTGINTMHKADHRNIVLASLEQSLKTLSEIINPVSQEQIVCGVDRVLEGPIGNVLAIHANERVLAATGIVIAVTASIDASIVSLVADAFETVYREKLTNYKEKESVTNELNNESNKRIAYQALKECLRDFETHLSNVEIDTILTKVAAVLALHPPGFVSNGDRVYATLLTVNNTVCFVKSSILNDFNPNFHDRYMALLVAGGFIPASEPEVEYIDVPIKLDNDTMDSLQLIAKERNVDVSTLIVQALEQEVGKLSQDSPNAEHIVTEKDVIEKELLKRNTQLKQKGANFFFSLHLMQSYVGRTLPVLYCVEVYIPCDDTTDFHIRQVAGSIDINDITKFVFEGGLDVTIATKFPFKLSEETTQEKTSDATPETSDEKKERVQSGVTKKEPADTSHHDEKLAPVMAALDQLAVDDGPTTKDTPAIAPFITEAYAAYRQSTQQEHKQAMLQAQQERVLADKVDHANQVLADKNNNGRVVFYAFTDAVHCQEKAYKLVLVDKAKGREEADFGIFANLSALLTFMASEAFGIRNHQGIIRLHTPLGKSTTAPAQSEIDKKVKKTKGKKEKIRQHIIKLQDQMTRVLGIIETQQQTIANLVTTMETQQQTITNLMTTMENPQKDTPA